MSDVLPVSVEALERATLAAVVPERLEEAPGWLLPMDPGTVNRARSAVPLHHGAPDPAVLSLIEARYRAHGLQPLLRLPVDQPAFADFEALLQARGYIRTRPTQVMVGRAEAMAQAGPGEAVRLDTEPGEDWTRAYLGEGFDPVDGAHRVRLLGRAHQAVYASVAGAVSDSSPVAVPIAAVGCAAFSEGLVSVHGMRTHPRFRSQGLARQLMAAMGAEALRRGSHEAFLQVELENVLARSLYARVGFAPAWIYAYWTPEGGG